MKTLQERIAELYPDHFQRIMELTHKDGGTTEEAMRSPAPDFLILSSLFVWHDTVEGHYYWAALSAGKSSEGEL